MVVESLRVTSGTLSVGKKSRPGADTMLHLVMTDCTLSTLSTFEKVIWKSEQKTQLIDAVGTSDTHKTV
jgi:hypothetical protein